MCCSHGSDQGPGEEAVSFSEERSSVAVSGAELRRMISNRIARNIIRYVFHYRPTLGFGIQIRLPVRLGIIYVYIPRVPLRLVFLRLVHRYLYKFTTQCIYVYVYVYRTRVRVLWRAGARARNWCVYTTGSRE